MVTAVTLNPCVDHTLMVSRLIAGGHHETVRTHEDISGKGINVNKVLRQLGVETGAVGFDFIGSDSRLRDCLREMNIPFAAVPAEGMLRINTKIFDMACSEMTEINSKGSPVTLAEVQKLIEVFTAALADTEILVLDGSVPPGVPDTIYRTMVQLAHERNIPVILDASGELMKKGLEARPEVIKPNREEAEQLLGRPVRNRQDAVSACRAFLDLGVGAVCLSLGKEGAVYCNSEGVWFSPGLDVEVKSLQGAGDSMVAGICIGLLKKYSGEEILRSASAAAHGSILLEGTSLCTADDYRKFIEKIPVVRI